jgi:hypothetical protein
VIRKAHLQWGIEKGKPLAGSISPLDPADRAASSQSFTKLLYTSSSCPSPTDSTNSTSPLSHNARPGQCFVSHGLARSVPAGCDISVTNTSANPRTKVLSSDRHSGEIDSARANSSHSFSPCLQQIVPNFHDQGVQFYINRYIMGHNDQPHTPTDPRTGWWIWAPPLQDAMAAVGLAGLANLRNSDIQLATSARQRYTAALSRTGRMIQKNDPSESWVTTRLVVLLAMYEVVAKSSTTQSSVNAHFIGAAALMRSFISPDISGSVAFQSMIQLCYASFIPTFACHRSLPSFFFEWLDFCRRVPDPSDTPGLELATYITILIQWSAKTHNHCYHDQSTEILISIRELVSLEKSLASWESALDRKWIYSSIAAPDLPPHAVYNNNYHRYLDLWVARVWNYYRWARIMTCQLLMDLRIKYPLSVAQVKAIASDDDYLLTVSRMAGDILHSMPSHWCHPHLSQKQIGLIEPGEEGSGSAGMPAVLVHLKTAATAPGVPAHMRQWAYEFMQCIWSEMGIAQARSSLDLMAPPTRM